MDIIEETFPETNQHEIVIEKLLGKRLQNDKVEYLVKVKKFPYFIKWKYF